MCLSAAWNSLRGLGLAGLLMAILAHSPVLHADDPDEQATGSVENLVQPIPDQLHWSWRPLMPSLPPNTSDKAWPGLPIDRFILFSLEQAGLHPALPVDRRTYIRRLSFDLIGLPPSPERIQAFLDDQSPDAFEKLVDGLLSSPHFGEHWGQHWLDLMRFAETHGHEQDFPIPEAYRYRDYVIEAFNEDVPYDQLVIEHIAGDLIDNPRLHPADGSNQSIQGTGFWHLGEATHSPVDIRGDEADRVHNQIDVFSRAFLGLSMGCARCHDHKFDPILMRDYYALYGYLQSSSYQLADVSDPARQRKVRQRLLDLKSQHQPGIVAAFVELKRFQLQRLVAYLLAACDVHRHRQGVDATVAASPDGSVADRQSGAHASPVDHASVVSVAAQRRLDAETLARVVEHLEVAASEPQEPLHWLAKAAALPESPTADNLHAASLALLKQFDDRASLARQRSSQLNLTKSESSQVRGGPPLRDSSSSDVVEDFLTSDPERWITSGLRFGGGPGQPGQVLLGRDRDRPIQRILDEHAAESEMLSARLSGFLRTRTFEVTGDTLWYRFRGSADVFLAVDSHRVVHGPLHAVVAQKLRGEPNRWQWQSHNVRDYIGHRVHVEFTPREGFALDRIEFSAAEPPEGSQIEPLLRKMVLSAIASELSLETIAKTTTKFLEASLDRLCDDCVEREDACLLNWMIDHPAIFEPARDLQQRFTGRVATYLEQKSAAEQLIPQPILALALLDGNGEDEPIHIRGNHRNRSEQPVPRSILVALGGGGDQRRVEHGSGRLDLARRMADPANPLVSRVMVNRIWHHLFGRAIVPTVDDFGAMGEPPTHPELLDFLAQRLIDNGWSIKRTIREMVLSSTYRMSSHPRPACEVADPANQLLHRMPIRRLAAESIRDHILAVSGRLDRRLHGPSIMVHISQFMRGNRSPAGSGPLDGAGRRSIYTEVRRNHLPAMLLAFDKPVPFTALGRRNISNSPAQPLILLNDPFVHQQAEIWADRTLRIPGDDALRLEEAYVRAFGRPPCQREVKTAMRFLKQQMERHRDEGETDPRRAAWVGLCHTLMNVKEFLYIN